MKRAVILALATVGALAGVPLLGAAPKTYVVRPLDPDWKGVRQSNVNVPALRTCATEDPPALVLREVERELAPYLGAPRQDLAKRRPKPKTIGVAVLVIHSGDDGFLTLQDVDDQIAVLNSAYASHGVRFTRAGAFEVDAPDLFVFAQGWPQELTAKTLLDQKGFDSKHYLRIYTIGLPSLLLGWSTFPWDRSKSPLTDGVVINFGAFPHGEPPYDLGYTTVHEVGHWLGLLHPFQGGCDGEGDEVADTPAESWPSAGCPIGRDTCAEGDLDDVTNFMDYSDDACMSHFTRLQAVRLTAMGSKYRRQAFR